jgi:YesN/AraC family two-component response regulator
MTSIAARIEAPDLILSDVMMPGLSGIELAIAIQRECPECKILLFSGHAHTLLHPSVESKPND